MSIKVHESGISLERIAALLSSIPKQVQQASGRAMQRAAQSGRTQAGKLVTAEYHITPAQFRGKTKESVKTQGLASITIRYAGSVIPLIQFNVKRSASGIFAKAMKSSGGAVLRNSFIATLGSSPNVYTRLTPARFPIKKLFGPSTGHMMQNEKVADKMVEVMQETYERRFEHELNRILGG